MYNVVSFLNDGTVVLKDIKSGEVKAVSLSFFRKLCSEGKIHIGEEFFIKDTDVKDNKSIEDAYELSGEKTLLQNTFSANGIVLLDKTALDNHIKYRLRNVHNSRDFVKRLRVSKNPMIIVSGIRRTGKTTGLLQHMRYLRNKKQSVCYVFIARDTTFKALYDFLLNYCFSYDYICIDEITRCKDFVANAAYLSDIYIDNKKQIVITGTDSFALDMARDTTLFGRTEYINTSLVSYVEYKRIFDKSFADYLKTATLYSFKELGFDNVRDLLSLTLCENIVNSLKKNNNNIMENELEFYVFNLIVKQIVTSYTIEPMVGNTPLCDDDLRKDLRAKATNALLSSLHVVADDIQFSQKKMQSVEQMLVKMGVLFEVKNVIRLGEQQHYIVALPGVNYSLLAEFNEILKFCCKECKVSLEDNKGVYGHIYECLIISNLKINGYKPYFCRNSDGSFEVDIVLKTNKFLYLLEVKGKNKKASDDFKHLRDTDMIATYFDNVPYKKFVLYMGETENKQDDCYINIEEFLLNIAKFIK